MSTSVSVVLEFTVPDDTDPTTMADLIGEMFADALESVPIALPGMYESCDAWEGFHS